MKSSCPLIPDSSSLLLWGCTSGSRALLLMLPRHPSAFVFDYWTFQGEQPLLPLKSDGAIPAKRLVTLEQGVSGTLTPTDANQGKPIGTAYSGWHRLRGEKCNMAPSTWKKQKQTCALPWSYGLHFHESAKTMKTCVSDSSPFSHLWKLAFESQPLGVGDYLEFWNGSTKHRKVRTIQGRNTSIKRKAIIPLDLRQQWTKAWLK